VLTFLRDLAKRSKPFATRDLEQLQAYASRARLPLNCKAGTAVSLAKNCVSSATACRRKPCAPTSRSTKCWAACLPSYKSLYGIEIAEIKGFDTWHPDVRLFEIKENGQHVGRFFFDLYARANKRGGAWMDGARDRRRTAAGACKARWLTWCATSPRRWRQACPADPR
jgi:oligopeptidase A